MGACCCKTNSDNKVEPTESEPNAAATLTVEERKAISSTWKRINYDFTSRGIRVFEIILREPQLKQLFPFRHLSGETLKQNALFRAHASRFVQSVSAVVEELEHSLKADTQQRDPLKPMDDWKLGQLLHGLGEAHGTIHGLSPEMFKETGKKAAVEALTSVWSEDLGTHWTPLVEKAWTHLFDAIITEMYQGLKSASGAQSPAHQPAVQKKSLPGQGAQRLKTMTTRLGQSITRVLGRIGGTKVGNQGSNNKKNTIKIIRHSKNSNQPSIQIERSSNSDVEQIGGGEHQR